MTDRPIIFSAAMVQALLAGRKTMTRRLVSGLKHDQPDRFQLTGTDVATGRWSWETWKGAEPCYPFQAGAGCVSPIFHTPKPGDRLYVREAWAPLDACTHNDPGVQATIDRGFYRADNSTIEGEIERWRPSIHMPRWASRLTLTVTDVRVERVADISCADAIAEGIPAAANSATIDCDTPDPREGFANLWNSLHAKPGTTWADNPWVVAISFDVAHGNIDRLSP